MHVAAPLPPPTFAPRQNRFAPEAWGPESLPDSPSRLFHTTAPILPFHRADNADAHKNSTRRISWDSVESRSRTPYEPLRTSSSSDTPAREKHVPRPVLGPVPPLSGWRSPLPCGYRRWLPTKGR